GRRPGGFLGWLLDGNPLGRRLVFRAARKQVLAQTRGNYPAPLAALEAVEHGLRHGMAAGLKREAELFGQLAVTDVSRKLVQIFFATTALKKDFGIPDPPPPATVHRLGVVGAGFMGSGIAGTAIVQAGVGVCMKDADLPRVGKVLAAARDTLDDRPMRRGLMKYHSARPVALLPPLEVIPSTRTLPAVVTTSVAFGRRMGKTPIVVKDSPGFWINRILTPYMNEAGHLLVEGVAIEELDRLMVEFGFPVGPITLLDEVGMDVGEKVVGVMYEA